jgi:nucleoside-diphosphate-sugar epimerase
VKFNLGKTAFQILQHPAAQVGLQPRTMQICIIGGTRFLGPFVVDHLIKAGHDVAIFHRGQTEPSLPDAVHHIHGDRQHLLDFQSEFARLAPQLVLDLACYTEHEARLVMQAFCGIASRTVVISSQDVYQAYDRVRRISSGTPDPVPLTETSPLRKKLYPYRVQAKGENDWLHHYEKILVESAFMNESKLPATVLRLPMLYGPGDYQHRLFSYLKRMDDGRAMIWLEEGRSHWRCTRGYIENVAAAIAVAATDERAAGRVYNVGEERADTETEWIYRIGRIAGWNGKVMSVKKEHLPQHLVFDWDWQQHLTVDTSRMRVELDYVEPVSLADAMQRTVEWERTHPPEMIDLQHFDYAAEDVAMATNSAIVA